MVKSEIISILSEKIRQKIKKSELETIINLILKTIIEEIKYQKATEIRRFGRFYPKKIKFGKNKMNFYIASRYIKEDLKITTSLNGEHNIKNILTSFAVNYCLGNTNNFFINVLKNDAIKEMRQIKSKWIRGSLLIDDTYNANPDSTRK